MEPWHRGVTEGRERVWKSIQIVDNCVRYSDPIWLQWRSEYWPFEYQTVWSSEFKWFWYSNGLFMYFVSFILDWPFRYQQVHKKTRWHPFVWYSNGWPVPNSNCIWIPNLFGIQPLFDHLNTKLIWYSDPHCTYFLPFEYPTSPVIRLWLYSNQIMT